MKNIAKILLFIEHQVCLKAEYSLHSSKHAFIVLGFPEL